MHGARLVRASPVARLGGTVIRIRQVQSGRAEFTQRVVCGRDYSRLRPLPINACGFLVRTATPFRLQSFDRVHARPWLQAKDESAVSHGGGASLPWIQCAGRPTRRFEFLKRSRRGMAHAGYSTDCGPPSRGRAESGSAEAASGPRRRADGRERQHSNAFAKCSPPESGVRLTQGCAAAYVSSCRSVLSRL